MTAASAFFFYCPFSGSRLARALAGIEEIARAGEVRVCAVDVPLPESEWLHAVSPRAADLVFYRTGARGGPLRDAPST
jgi:hypothetical protein